MKKAIALFTVFALLFTLSAPAFAQQDAGKQLEELIIKVKSAFDMPDTLVLNNTNMYTDENGTTRWHLNWSDTPSDMGYKLDSTNISIEICDDGFISSYSKYTNSYYKYSQFVKLPTISKDTATEYLKSFIAKVCPQIENEAEWNEPSVNEGNYSYHLRRSVNGINVSYNYASFTVDGKTGEVNNYYSNWNTKINLTSPEDAISLEKAQEIYKDNMPLDLEYRIDHEDNIYVQYTASREKGVMYINAITGEVEKPQYDYGIYAYGNMGEGRYYKDSTVVANLSTSEQKEIDEISGTMTVEEAEKKIRSMSELKLDDSYKLAGSSLYQNKTKNSETTYLLNINFTKMDITEDMTEDRIKLMIAAGDGKGYANATFNAKTGELTSFSSYNWNEDTSGKKEYTKENSREIAESFINKVQPNKLSLLKFVDNNNNNPSYQYCRIENGAYFSYDGISVTIDEFSGKINNYSYGWTNIDNIPSLENVIGSDKAHDLLFANDGLRLEYIQNNNDIVLVYRINDTKPQFIDAFSGEVLDYSGKPYKEQSAPAYGDISGHFSENAVKELVNIGVFLNGESFEPDTTIKQKDYIMLLSKLGMYRYETDLENIYSYIISNEIMDASEKNPEGYVTREDAIKFLLRFLDFKKFAEIPGIFICDFEDVAEINPALVGYASIAKGIGIINGSNGNFKPKDILTKGESAVIIYNCLKANIY